MEEDIKVIEKLLKIFEMLRKDDEEGHSSAYELQWEDIQAIENLIARNKDLEKNYINPNKARISYFDKGKGTKVVIEGFIPKLKVKEKIEEYEKQRIKMEEDDIGVGFTLGKEWSDLKAKIQVLQELLED